MPTEMSEQEIYEEAKKRVKAKQRFYRHPLELTCQ